MGEAQGQSTLATEATSALDCPCRWPYSIPGHSHKHDSLSIWSKAGGGRRDLVLQSHRNCVIPRPLQLLISVKKTCGWERGIYQGGQRDDGWKGGGGSHTWGRVWALCCKLMDSTPNPGTASDGTFSLHGSWQLQLKF